MHGGPYRRHRALSLTAKKRADIGTVFGTVRGPRPAGGGEEGRGARGRTGSERAPRSTEAPSAAAWAVSMATSSSSARPA
jgi:hypothetical protein